MGPEQQRLNFDIIKFGIENGPWAEGGSVALRHLYWKTSIGTEKISTEK